MKLGTSSRWHSHIHTPVILALLPHYHQKNYQNHSHFYWDCQTLKSFCWNKVIQWMFFSYWSNKKLICKNWDPDRGLCYCHSSVNLSSLQPMAPWSLRQYTSVLPLTSMGLRPRNLDTSVAVTPTPVQVPTQLFTLPLCCLWCPWSCGLWPKKLYTSVVVTSVAATTRVSPWS